MSIKKRRLTNQQIQNIRKQRENKVKKLQEQELSQLLATENLDSPLQEGIVISRYGKQADVMPLENGKYTNLSYRAYMKALLSELVVGDKVFFHQINDDAYYIVEAEERKSLLTRYYFNKEKNIAANIDSMIITSSINPTFNTEIIDRYIVAAENSKIKPIIIVNKFDLLTDENEKEQVLTCIDYYQALGYEIFPVSTYQNLNIDKLKGFLANGLHIFVGQTGVGKSSLINAVFGKELMQVGEINETTKLGKHTTTTSHLFKINDYAGIIDSPGIREFSIENYRKEQIKYGFKELRDEQYHCKFSDCNHINNLGCGIQLLLEDQKISEFRYNNLLNLLEQAEEK